MAKIRKNKPVLPKKKKLTVLVDIDDTLIDLLGHWVDFLNKKYDLSVKVEDIKKLNKDYFFSTLSRRQVYAHLEDPAFYEGVKPKAGAVELIEKLQKDGHDVLLCTSTWYTYLVPKLEKAFFPLFPSLSWQDIIVTTRKDLVKGDFLIDDTVYNLQSGDYKKILLEMPYNEHVNLTGTDIVRVKNLDEAYRIIDAEATKEESET